MADPYFRLRARVKSRSLEMVEAAAQSLGRQLNDVAPKDTGALRESQKISISDSETRSSVNITYEVPYWKFTDQGADAHPIFPKNASKLRFRWEDSPEGDRWVTADMVDHPGQKGTNWYSNIVNAQKWSEALAEASRG